MCSGFLLRSPSGSVYLSLGSASACPRVSPSLGGNYTSILDLRLVSAFSVNSCVSFYFLAAFSGS